MIVVGSVLVRIAAMLVPIVAVLMRVAIMDVDVDVLVVPMAPANGLVGVIAVGVIVSMGRSIAMNVNPGVVLRGDLHRDSRPVALGAQPPKPVPQAFPHRTVLRLA
ncbi:MAG: hypothetical protein M3R44_04600 [Candidatus Eremiobacteraeota bacterium]|nr:hypothetical protein [Candidatus Eremiobacteraeota bacterium]